MPFVQYSSEDYYQRLQQTLVKAGDFVLFELSDLEDDDIYVSYLSEIKFSHTEQAPHKAINKEPITIHKIKRSDFAEHFQNDYAKLAEFIKVRLCTIVGLDFDGVLTYHNTELDKKKLTQQNISIKDNRLFPNTTNAILHALLAQPQLKTIIATNNYSETVREHLKAWELPILDVFSLGDLGHNNFNLKKSTCFQNTFLKWVAPTQGDYLDIRKILDENLSIAIITCYLVDDDEDENIEKEYGIRFIHALDKKEPLHLSELNKIFELKLDIDTLKKDDISIPTIQKSVHNTTIRRRKLNFDSDNDSQNTAENVCTPINKKTATETAKAQASWMQSTQTPINSSGHIVNNETISNNSNSNSLVNPLATSYYKIQ